MRVKSQQKPKSNFPIFSIKSILFIASFLFVSIVVSAQDTNFTVVLDPGHGGKDSGTRGSGRYKDMYEKDVALNVALKVGKLLNMNHSDIKVIYTRDTDKFIELRKRGEIANKADADLFVSIHANAATQAARGTETFVLGTHRNETNLAVAKMENDVILLEDNYEKHYSYDPKNPESLILLTLMQEDFLDQSIRMAKILEKEYGQTLKRKSRGVKQAGFIVLHQTYMPSILTEIGFLSNHAEEDFLRTTKGQKEIASAIAEAIETYRDELLQSKSQVDIVAQEQETDVYEGVTFKVQIASSGKSVEPKPQNFKGLSGVERIKVGNYYRYYLGNTSDYNAIKTALQKALEKGYKDAFIVAFKGTERVALNQLLKK
jgi:N-acetylmuramoyl-L-alanine amidase